MDWKIRSGQLRFLSGFGPRALGADFAGVVQELGSGVTGWKVGDEVYGSPSLSDATTGGPTVVLRSLFQERLRIGKASSGPADCAELEKLVSSRAVRPLIDRVLPLERALRPSPPVSEAVCREGS